MILLRAYEAAIDSVRGDRCVERALAGADFPPVDVLAVGKAAGAMALGAQRALDGRVDRALVITKDGHSLPDLSWEQIEAGHPMPDDRSVVAGARALAFVKKADRLLFLLSGGASALMELPREPYDLEAVRVETQRLLNQGADIVELNRRRKELSRIKGGGLGEAFGGEFVQALVISDVIGDDLATIGSGPFWPHAEHRIVASLGIALEAAASVLRSHGCEVQFDSRPFVGEARDWGADLARRSHELRPGAAYVRGGEPVVRVTGDGLGGRAQETALAAATETLAEGCELLVAGTDGTDGPVPAAGAKIDHRTPGDKDVLERNDSHLWAARTGAILVTGPTGTNVNDLAILIRNSDDCR